ncbi:MAG: hypothetical protein WC313_06425 [Candidatus Kapaibacterium sp.]|nr:DUF4249 family protein [Candidatus Kapabacteria bacterium]
MKILWKLLLLVVIIAQYSCEDTSNSRYIEDYIVEALIVVDEPIEGITVMKSQPLDLPFNYDSAMVRDAVVRIEGDGHDFLLEYRNREDGEIGYYFPDTTYKIKPETEYRLEVTLSNGRFISGKTFTPNRSSWVYYPENKFIRFPIDSINQPSNDSIVWTKVSGFEFYLISITNLDTLNYGIYLEPPTNEPNRRVYRPFGSPNAFRDVSTMFPLPTDRTPIVWNAFRWFGKHELKVYVPDWNFLRWFLQAQTRGEADPILTSLEGGIGYFGSASVITYDFFLLKNQP